MGGGQRAHFKPGARRRSARLPSHGKSRNTNGRWSGATHRSAPESAPAAGIRTHRRYTLSAREVARQLYRSLWQLQPPFGPPPNAVVPCCALPCLAQASCLGWAPPPIRSPRHTRIAGSPSQRVCLKNRACESPSVPLRDPHPIFNGSPARLEPLLQSFCNTEQHRCAD